MTKKQATIKYFTELNADMLSEILDDVKTYQDVSKHTFIQKLTKVFNTQKNVGDTFLNPTAGVCNNKDCNYKCHGISFKGNASGKVIDFIFEENETDYTDIFYCHNFAINGKETDYGDKIEVSFSIDETADFEPSINYLLLQNSCNKVYEDFVEQYQNTTLTINDIKSWQRLHNQLFHRLPKHAYMLAAYLPFYKLYNKLSTIQSYVQQESMVKTALDAYNKIPKLSYIKKMKWRKKYSTSIVVSHDFYTKHTYMADNDFVNGLRIIPEKNISFAKENFISLFTLAKLKPIKRRK